MPCTKKFLRLLTITSFVLLTAAIQSSETDFTQYVSTKLLEYRQVLPIEKAYLHLDKPYYVTGDTLWFKAYLAEGSVHWADSASNLLYVDLIEHRTGKNFALKQVRLDGGIGHGDLILTDSIPNGSYTIRAYTNWMRNFTEDFFFHKDIYVFGQDEHVPTAIPDKTDLQFFPEGGELVAGISTRIAFKAVDGRGLGQDVNGFVLNQSKDTVASFRNGHLGMGRFQFEAKPGETYSAFLKTKNGLVPLKFPEIKENGYTMIVDNLSNPLKMRIIAYAKIPDKIEVPVHIVAHSRGVIAFVAKGKIANKGLMMNLPTTELPDGITHLTLFNDENKPVCERLVFINHGRSLQVKINPSKTTYKPREKSEVEITVSDSAGKPVETSLSVAVTDAGQILQQPFDQNIVSYLLLSSDLKGFIEQPAYYFDPEKSERKIHMDYLMMTQGWSRFRWNDVLQDSLPAPKRFVEQGITLEGEVTRNNKKVQDKILLSVYLSSDSLSTFMTAESGANGRFAIYNLVFADSLKLRLQGMNKRGNQNLSFKLTPFMSPPMAIVKIPYYPITIDVQKLDEYLKRAAQDQEITRRIRESRERLLKEVTIKAKKNVPRDSRKLYSSADATVKITPQMAAGSMSVLDLLAGRVAGVRVSGSGMNASVSIRGNLGEPLFVLDGMPVDKDFITSLNVNDIESVDVLKGPGAAIFGSRGGNGVISVLTKRGNENYDYSQDIVPGVLVSKIPGFNVARDFYSPTYEVSNTISALPDYRSTIFWAPMLRTDRNGKAKLTYFNSDAATNVEIRAEVLSTYGLPGFGKSSYLVN
ncbi:TonB-dependent receptor plug domain-containing protein [Dyadobacter arcticus]|uniref:TonB-dependent SusC/RagA subfamily outer membrane receptor n=1 Tax=Dyadobacter arcticus TaxID=1078754 RepID=A0ABX0UD64_9BACT|nr:TonB-dependent receptor plug domain-containing protein [Dyadobacter arcticus]NIJ50862.1 TonB-dependent SusC/RagA subfamily outer membrane receptor [Dyadobacter arcticus]